MAYYRPRKSPKSTPNTPPEDVQLPSLSDIWNTMKAPLAGFWQGLSGRNMTWEQYMREKKRKQQGFDPPGKNWFQRITGK